MMQKDELQGIALEANPECFLFAGLEELRREVPGRTAVTSDWSIENSFMLVHFEAERILGLSGRSSRRWAMSVKHLGS